MLAEVERFVQIVRRRLIVVVVVCLLGIAAASLLPGLVPATYQATARLLVVNEAGKDTSLTSADLPSILQSTEVLERVKQRLSLNIDVVAIRKAISTKVPERSSILQVSYRDSDSQRAADVANAIADETSAYFHEIATRRYANVIDVLNAQLAKVRAHVAGANGRLQGASANMLMSSSDKAEDDLSARLSALQVERGQVYAALVADSAAASALLSQRSKIAAMVRADVLQHDPQYQELQAQFTTDAAQLAASQIAHTDLFPGIVALSEKVDRERQALKAAEASAVRNGAGLSLSNAVAGDRARLSALDMELREERANLQRLAGPGAAIGTLRAERDAAAQQYLTLTGRLSVAQADAAQAASLGTLVVIDRAVAGAQSGWAILLHVPVVLGLIISAIAIAAAYAADNIDRRFWEASDIEDLYDRPVLLTLEDVVEAPRQATGRAPGNKSGFTSSADRG